MKKLFIALLVSIVLAIILTAALEIKRYVIEPKQKEQPVIGIQPQQQPTHRNIACRIQKKSFKNTYTKAV